MFGFIRLPSLLLIISITCFAADNSTEAIQQRIRPIGEVYIAEQTPAPASASPNAAKTAAVTPVNASPNKITSTAPATANASPNTATSTTATTVNVGETTYNKACVACHAAGVAGAPKLGDSQ